MLHSTTNNAVALSCRDVSGRTVLAWHHEQSLGVTTNGHGMTKLALARDAGWHFGNGLSWSFVSVFRESEPRMQPGSVYRERTLWQAFALAILLAVVGIVLIIAGASISCAGTALAESGACRAWKCHRHFGCASALWEWHLKRAFAEEIFDAAGIASQLSQAKMVAVTTDFMHGVRWAEAAGQGERTGSVRVFRGAPGEARLTSTCFGWRPAEGQGQSAAAGSG